MCYLPARQTNVGIRYEAHTLQNVFLQMIYEGVTDKHNDIRTELKPLLSDPSVTDEALLRQVIKNTREESERRRRLGHNTRTSAVYAQSGQSCHCASAQRRQLLQRKGKPYGCPSCFEQNLPSWYREMKLKPYLSYATFLKVAYDR